MVCDIAFSYSIFPIFKIFVEYIVTHNIFSVNKKKRDSDCVTAINFS